MPTVDSSAYQLPAIALLMLGGAIAWAAGYRLFRFVLRCTGSSSVRSSAADLGAERSHAADLRCARLAARSARSSCSSGISSASRSLAPASARSACT